MRHLPEHLQTELVLEERRQLHKFMEEAEEESLWLQEKLQSVKSTEAGHDLNSTQLLITKHEQIEDELKFRKPHCDQIVQSGEQLIASKCYNSKENEKLKSKFELLKTQFESLREAAKNRRSLLEDSFSSQQYFADATYYCPPFGVVGDNYSNSTKS